VEDKKTFPGKVEEETKYADESQTSAQYPSMENSFISSGPEAGECGRNDAAATLQDISDSELLCQKQKKANVLDGLLDVDEVDSVDENTPGDVLPLTAMSSSSAPVSSPGGETPELDANSFLRAVRSFPLPEGQRNRPVVGPPSLDQEMLRKMEQLQIPLSLPQEDVERIARLEVLKQLSCRVDSTQ